jgi:glycosyltransferase involved in cell wall biosynthesis
MSEITLSYVLTTFNKLAFIKVILPELIINKKNDEEIIVIDGGSTDGTYEFLNELKKAEKINNFISEKDKGEAHGFNKGVLLAKGILIKIISDDDAFYYPAINICKKYMLLHPELDVLAGNTAVTYSNNYKNIDIIRDYQDSFVKWRAGELVNFAFCGTPVMIRRSSLPLTGLFDIKSKIPDFEWTIRVTGFANVAWYTGFAVVNIINNLSNSTNSYTVFKVWPEEWGKFVHFYNWIPPKKIMRNFPLLPVSFKIRLTRFKFRNYYKSIRRKTVVGLYEICLKTGLIEKKKPEKSDEVINFEIIHQECQRWLIDKNKESNFEFLQKNPSGHEFIEFPAKDNIGFNR